MALHGMLQLRFLIVYRLAVTTLNMRVNIPIRQFQSNVQECDIALMRKLEDISAIDGLLPRKRYIFKKAYTLKQEIACYQRSPEYTDATRGPGSSEEFDLKMQQFARIMTESKSKDEFTDWIGTYFDMNVDTMWPYMDDENLTSHKEEISKVPVASGAWNREIEYVSFIAWKNYQDQMWQKFLEAFRGPQKKKIVIAVDVNAGGGGNTKKCHTCEYCFPMFCKSTMWSLVHIWNYIFNIPSSYGFMRGVDLFFYTNGVSSFSPERSDVHTLVLHLQDASYSGDQIMHLTKVLKAPPTVTHVGMVVIGKDFSGYEGMKENPQKSSEFSKPCSLAADRCFIFGKVMESGLQSQTCGLESSFDYGAHFLVQHKAADDISLGDCWQWYQFLGLISPYSRDHRYLEVQRVEPKRQLMSFTHEDDRNESLVKRHPIGEVETINRKHELESASDEPQAKRRRDM